MFALLKAFGGHFVIVFFTACNAMETLLIHKDLMQGNFFTSVCQMLKDEGVKIYSGKHLVNTLTFGPPPAKSMKHEYGSLECCIEVVNDAEAAIDHIHRYGSSHTDVIVTENGKLKSFLFFFSLNFQLSCNLHLQKP